MDQKIKNLEEAIRYLAQMLAMNEAREQRDSLDEGTKEKFDFHRHVKIITKEVDGILNQ